MLRPELWNRVIRKLHDKIPLVAFTPLMGYSPAAVRTGRKHRRPENRPIIRIFQAANVCYARIYHRLQVVSPCHLPRDGPAILVSNHTSGLDPLLIQSVCNRLIVWMVAREYYELPALNWIFRLIEAIPVERGSRDIASTRKALRALEDGYVLGVFPEGRLETSRQLLPFQTGVSLMAIKTGIPVHPVFLDGTQRNRSMRAAFLYPHVAKVAFGPPFRLDREFSTKDLDGATFALQQAVQSLGKEPHCVPAAGPLPRNNAKIPVWM